MDLNTRDLRCAALGVVPAYDDAAIDAIVAAALATFVRCYALPGVASKARLLGVSAP